MDFNTGSGSERPGDESRPLFGEEAGGQPPGDPPRGPVGNPGGEFNLSDPVGRFTRTVVAVLTQPVAFFRSIARRGDFMNPAVFAVICALISALLSGILSLILAPLFAGPGDTGEALAGGVGGFLINLILTPIFTVITLLIWAGILHLLVRFLVSPQNAGFEATFRVSSYASVIQLISWIPILGGLVALVWGAVLSILGIREVHATTTGKAALVVLIAVAVLIFIVLLITAVVSAVLFSIFSIMSADSP